MDDEIEFSPSALEVDYDKNLTELYQAITDQDWDRAVNVCKFGPEQAATWVVRHYDDDEEEDDDEEPEVMWRFLPLHSACARQPPAKVISALLRAYPDGARCQDDQGMFALHYACGNQASRDVIRLLLVSYPEAAKQADPRGMLPIHYLACWGPSTVAVVDMLLVANRDVASAKDHEGKTPVDLAREAEYQEKESVVEALQQWFVSKSVVPPSVDAGSYSISSRSGTSAGNNNKRSLGRQQREGTNGTNGKIEAKSSSTHSKSSNPESKTLTKTFKNKKSSTTSNNSDFKFKIHSLLDDDAEEKKEDEEVYVVGRGLGPSDNLKPTISPREVKRLREEIRTLTSEKQEWEKKLSDAYQKSDEQAVEILDLRDQLDEVKSTSDKQMEGAEDQGKELRETRSKLRECREEVRGLRVTLGDMMEEHETVKKRSTHLHDRLDSLTLSLESLMDRQETVVKTMKQRDEKRRKALEERQDKLKDLIDLSEMFQEEDDDSSVATSLRKQKKEIEAIAAVIEAVRE